MKTPLLRTLLQCLSPGPVSRALPFVLACDVLEPRVRIHMIVQGWYFGVAACARVNASGSRNMHTPCNLQRWSSAQAASSGSVCRERHCKMCLICSLYAHAFPKMLRIPALDHTTSLWGGVHRSFAPSLRVWCVSWVFEVRRFVNFKRFFIPRLKKFAGNF